MAVKVDFRKEAFYVLGGERKEGVWGKSRYSEGRVMVLGEEDGVGLSRKGIGLGCRL